MRSFLISAVLAIGTIAVSCSKSGLETPPVPPKPNGTPVEVSLSTAPLETPLTMTPSAKAARASGGGALTVDYDVPDSKSVTPLTSDQEQKINDLWVIQFDKATGTLVGQPYYATPEQIAQNGTAVSFEAKLTTASTPQVVYFVANTNSPSTFTASNCGTVTAMESVFRRLSAEYKPTAAGGLPMLAAQEYAVIASGTPLTGATLRRLVAKVVLRYRVSPDFAGFTLTGVRMRNVPTTMWYAAEKSGAVDFPAKNVTYGSESHFDYPAEDLSKAEADGQYMTFTWYVPENLRKSVTAAADEIERVLANTDGMATYIEISGNFKSPRKCERLAYRILLGDVQNDVDDYNVRRNRVYTATVTLEGRNAADKRVMVGTFDMNNSAIVVPNSKDAGAATFDIRKLTNGWQTTMPTLGQNAALSAAILWTDNASIATQLGVDLDKVNGLLTVKSNGTAAGNAVVALYNNATAGSGEILWSWHIWVTDYAPDGERAYGLPANAVAAVAGGQVHTYGTQFMAKNPGKVIMDRNLGATKAYYAPPAAGDATAEQCFGMFYQWGRKDPLPRWDGVSTSSAATIALYGPDGTALSAANGYKTVAVATAVSGAANALTYSMKYPLTFICNDGGTFDWYASVAANQNNDLWSDGAVKSAYDPCPEGWRVPVKGAWNDFTRISATEGTFLFYIDGTQSEAAQRYLTNGRYYVPTDGNVRTWYPATGFRNQESGLLGGLGNENAVWTSNANGPDALVLGSSATWFISNRSIHRVYGETVRCVQE